MSSAKGKRGQMDDADAGTADERNLLVTPIAEVARRLKPRVVVVENVPVFLQRKVRHPLTKVPISAARLLVSLLESDYVVFPLLADLSHYGVPQSRKRSFLTFVDRTEPGLQHLLSQGHAPYSRPTHDPALQGPAPITVEQVLTALNLPLLDCRAPETSRSDVHPLHVIPTWQDRRYDMVAAIPVGSGATAWENDECPNCHTVEEDPSAAACGTCGEPLLRPVVQEDGEWRLIKGFRTSSYKRMLPGAPAPTITTATGHLGSHSTIHPTEVRVLSALECAHLQTFPEDFDWGRAVERAGITNVRAMIGEAVPPRFTYLHGLAIRGALTGAWHVVPISASDRRCVTARARLFHPTRAKSRHRAGTGTDAHEKTPRQLTPEQYTVLRRLCRDPEALHVEDVGPRTLAALLRRGLAQVDHTVVVATDEGRRRLDTTRRARAEAV
jgi:DNA (cytosine-5)-methyltransferase 1